MPELGPEPPPEPLPEFGVTSPPNLGPEPPFGHSAEPPPELGPEPALAHSAEPRPEPGVEPPPGAAPAPEGVRGTPRLHAGLDVAPFVATRYADPERLATYTAPAYDLIEPAERARLVSADPRSIVHLTLPTFGAEDAAARLAAWRSDGTLTVERPAALFVYDLAGPGPHPATRGWVGAVALAPSSVVAPHEATVPSVVADRRALRAATCADLEPVVFAHDGEPGPAAALARRVVAERTPVADLTDDAGVRHRLWRVADPAEIAVVRADFATRRAVIADGHHRWAAASGQSDREVGAATAPAAAAATAPAAAAATALGAAVGAAHAAAAPAAAADRVDDVDSPATAAGVDAVPADRVLALLVPAGEHGPQVRAIHRVLPNTALDQVDVRAFRSEEVEPLTAGEAEELLVTAAAPLVLATDGERWVRLTDPDTAAVTPRAWRGLDVALVDVLLVGERAAVVLRHSVAAAVDEARRTGGVALLVRATATDTVLAVAGRGVLMPRKSTFFVPKPRTGLVLRCFADQR